MSGNLIADSEHQRAVTLLINMRIQRLTSWETRPGTCLNGLLKQPVDDKVHEPQFGVSVL